MPRAGGTRSTSHTTAHRLRASSSRWPPSGLAGCGDAGRRDATPAGSATPGAPAGLPKLAIVYTPQFRDGSWGEAAVSGAQKLKDAGVISAFAPRRT